MSGLNRRDFLKSMGLAAGAGIGLSGSRLAFGDANDTQNILIVLFLRGGCDCLNLFPPVSGADRAHYETARPNLKIPVASSLYLDGNFGVHPAATGLKTLFDNGQLALVRAVGNTVQPSRSHFDAQALLESGTPGHMGSGTGWLTRYFSTLPGLPPSIIIPSVAASNYTPTSFVGDPHVLTMNDPNDFSLDNAHWGWDARMAEILPGLYSGSSATEVAGSQALTAMEIIAGQDFNNYLPGGSAVYPQNYLGNHLKMIAQIIKMNVGLRVSAMDAGGWDTHNNQGSGSGGTFADNLVTPLADSLLAFMTDLAATGEEQRVTLVVQTEFGRRLRENADNGTDHGYGADMMVIGGQVNGGQVYGSWPGLSNEQLFDGKDVAVTTDFRQVLSEILIRRLENPYLGTIFPEFNNYAPLGVVQGTDLPVVYDDHNEIFSDGFED